MLNKKYCQKCGNPTDVAANFCGKCGNPFVAQANTQTAPKVIVVGAKKPNILPVVASEEDEPQGLPIEDLDPNSLGFEIPRFIQNKTKVQDILGSSAGVKDKDEFKRPTLPKQSKKKFLESFKNEAGGGATKPIEIN
jgi:hypothetical protein